MFTKRQVSCINSLQWIGCQNKIQNKPRKRTLHWREANKVKTKLISRAMCMCPRIGNFGLELLNKEVLTKIANHRVSSCTCCNVASLGNPKTFILYLNASTWGDGHWTFWFGRSHPCLATMRSSSLETSNGEVHHKQLTAFVSVNCFVNSLVWIPAVFQLPWWLSGGLLTVYGTFPWMGVWCPQVIPHQPLSGIAQSLFLRSAIRTAVSCS